MRKLLLLILIFGSVKSWGQTPTCSSAFTTSAFPQNICLGNAATFTISGPVGLGFNAVWNFEDGSPLVSGKSVSHTYNTYGNKSATVTITVGGIVAPQPPASSTAAAVAAVNYPPGYTCSGKVFVNVIPQPTIGNIVTSCAGEVTKFFFSGGPAGTLSGTIDFGDGQSETITGTTLGHKYSTKGTYTAKANITSTPTLPQDLACSQSITKTVIIPSCEVFECKNTDLETGELINWQGSAELKVTSGTATDPYGGFPEVAPGGGKHSLKIGNDKKNDHNSDYAQYAFVDVTKDKPFFAIRFAVVLEDINSEEASTVKPSISFVLSNHKEEILDCSDLTFSKITTPGLKKSTSKNVYYLPWTTYFLDLSKFVGTRMYINIKVNKGQYKDKDAIKNLFTYAYFDTYCSPPVIQTTGNKCIDSPIQFSSNMETAFAGETFTWNMGDGTILNGSKNVSHTYSSPGTYTVTMEYHPHLKAFPEGPLHSNSSNCGFVKLTKTIVIDECTTPFVCETCIPAFSPLPGEKYILYAWVKEGNGIGKHTYELPSIVVNFDQGTGTPPMHPSGLIIDGWQRIEGEFTVPANAKEIKLELHNDNNTVEVFFDDIRVQPFDASMKGFVYDPVTLRLVSELDERNYATFFEYDEEGTLTRVKKETERGVKTIRESRESLRKR